LSTHRLENLDTESASLARRLELTDDTESELDFLSFLTGNQQLDQFAADRIKQIAFSSSKPIPFVIVEFGFMEDDVVAQQICAFCEFPRFQISAAKEAISLDSSIDKKYLQLNHMCPIAIDENTVTVAVSNPLRPQAANAMAFALAKHLVLSVATNSEIEKLTAEIFEEFNPSTVATLSEMPLSEIDKERLRDFASDAPVIKLLNSIVLRAAESKASDIHIEPFEDRTRIRIRVDGVLRNLQDIDKSTYLGIVSRVKILAKLNIAENRLPQDGRMQFAVRGRNIEFRVATSPSVFGEAVVLRLLDRSSKILGLEELGFPSETISRIDNVLRQPNGMFLVSGPTGSGKTTTLYAALLRLNDPSRKIFTIEDPVEYQINGVTQIHTKPHIGLDFAQVLRSVLRQDPDIILVGEIRDKETAQIAVQASLTGHLVLSTIHTNSSSATITRLRNLGLDDHLLASSLRAVLAQRLVRRVCSFCSTSNQMSDSIVHSHTRQNDCKICGASGYSGRTTLSEFLDISETVAETISNGGSEFSIAAQLSEQGAESLQQSGSRLVRTGQTTSEEVLRVLVTS
jgi:general secretion pathway protein E